MFTKAVQVGVLWKDSTDLQVLVRKLHCRGKRERERAVLDSCSNISLVQPFLYKCGWMMTSV